MTHATIHYLDLPSPCGVLRLSADAQGLRGIRFEGRRGHGPAPAVV